MCLSLYISYSEVHLATHSPEPRSSELNVPSRTSGSLTDRWSSGETHETLMLPPQRKISMDYIKTWQCMIASFENDIWHTFMQGVYYEKRLDWCRFFGKTPSVIDLNYILPDLHPAWITDSYRVQAYSYVCVWYNNDFCDSSLAGRKESLWSSLVGPERFYHHTTYSAAPAVITPLESLLSILPLESQMFAAIKDVKELLYVLAAMWLAISIR